MNFHRPDIEASFISWIISSTREYRKSQRRIQKSFALNAGKICRNLVLFCGVCIENLILRRPLIAFRGVRNELLLARFHSRQNDRITSFSSYFEAFHEDFHEDKDGKLRKTSGINIKQDSLLGFWLTEQFLQPFPSGKTPFKAVCLKVNSRLKLFRASPIRDFIEFCSSILLNQYLTSFIMDLDEPNNYRQSV